MSLLPLNQLAVPGTKFLLLRYKVTAAATQTPQLPQPDNPAARRMLLHLGRRVRTILFSAQTIILYSMLWPKIKPLFLKSRRFSPLTFQGVTG